MLEVTHLMTHYVQPAGSPDPSILCEPAALDVGAQLSLYHDALLRSLALLDPSVWTLRLRAFIISNEKTLSIDE